MVRKQAPVAAPAAPVAAPAAPVAAPAAPVAAPAALSIMGTDCTLTKSQAALTTAKHGGRVMPGQQGVQYTIGGKPYKVRTTTNAAQWAAVQAAMQANGGSCTVAQVAAQGLPLTLCAPFVAYAVNRGWLAPVPA